MNIQSSSFSLFSSFSSSFSFFNHQSLIVIPVSRMNSNRALILFSPYDLPDKLLSIGNSVGEAKGAQS